MKTRFTRYIFIDPATQRVDTRFVHLDYEMMLSIIGCDTVEAIGLPLGDMLYFDGEPVAYNVGMDGVEFDGVQILGSRCMIIGPDHPKTGRMKNCQMTADGALALITWMPSVKIVGETFTETLTGGVVNYVLEPA